MKKFFTLVAMATMALAANAQNAKYTELGYAALELTSDATKEIAGETSLGTDDSGNEFATAFTDQLKLVGVTASGYNVITVNDVDNSISGGYQGSNNAKDEDGGNSANTLKQASQGSVLKVTAGADGYIYVVGKFSQNKQYVVFEDGSPIGYTVVCDGTAAGKAAEALTATVAGDDADGYFVTTAIAKLGALNGAGDAAANNGAGFIKFSAAAESVYYVHATGSKLTQCGTIFSETGDENIVLNGTDADGNALTSVVLESGNTAIDEVADAYPAAKAVAKKVIDNKQLVITKNGVNYNLAGQVVE